MAGQGCSGQTDIAASANNVGWQMKALARAIGPGATTSVLQAVCIKILKCFLSLRCLLALVDSEGCCWWQKFRSLTNVPSKAASCFEQAILVHYAESRAGAVDTVRTTRQTLGVFEVQ